MSKKALCLRVVLQAMEDATNDSIYAYSEDHIEGGVSAYKYSSSEAWAWLGVSGRYYLRKLGLSTERVNVILKSKENVQRFLNDYRDVIGRVSQGLDKSGKSVL